MSVLSFRSRMWLCRHFFNRGNNAVLHVLQSFYFHGFAVGDAEAKRQVLEDIGDVLRSHTDEELELMVGRYFKRSL